MADHEYNYFGPRFFARDCLPAAYYVEAPVTFGQEPAYLQDDNYRRHYRRQDSDYGRQYSLIPMEEVFRREDQGPWWMNGDFPHGGHDGYCIATCEHMHDQRVLHRTTVEMYVPLCCDKCVRKVRKHLEDLEGVESVAADQWEKKVVVVGYVRPDFVLRRVQRDKPGSVFWSDRHP